MPSGLSQCYPSMYPWSIYLWWIYDASMTWSFLVTDEPTNKQFPGVGRVNVKVLKKQPQVYLQGASWEWAISCWSSPCTDDPSVSSICQPPPPMQCTLLATSYSVHVDPASAPRSATFCPRLCQHCGQICFWSHRLSLHSSLSELGTWLDVEIREF